MFLYSLAARTDGGQDDRKTDAHEPVHRSIQRLGEPELPALADQIKRKAPIFADSSRSFYFGSNVPTVIHISWLRRCVGTIRETSVRRARPAMGAASSQRAGR